MSILRFFFSGHLSRSFSISQGTGQGRILAPFMYKVYLNSLLNEVSEHNFAICISGMKLSAPSFADDISLLVLYPTFLQHLINIAHEYSLKWRYEFINVTSGSLGFRHIGPKKLPDNHSLIKVGDWIKKVFSGPIHLSHNSQGGFL